MKTKTIVIGGVLILAIASGTGWMVLGRGKSAKSDDTAKVKKGQIVITVAETGTVQPLIKVEIRSRVAGQVNKLFVDAGDHIDKAQPLMQLDTTDTERNNAQASADLAIAKSRLARLIAGARPEELAESKADVRQAEAEFDRARTEYQRSRVALDAHALTTREFDAARGDYETSRARLEASRARLAKIKAGSRSEEIAEARAQLVKVEVALKATEDQIAYATIRAPMSGTVIKRGIEVGEMVSPGVSAISQGNPILVVADLSKLIITTNLNQIDVGKVRKGQVVEIRVDSAPGKVFKGSIRKVAPAADASKDGQNSIQTFAVETIVDGSDAAVLKPGMTADLDIKVATLENALYLPVEAVVRGKGDDGTVTLPGKDKKGKALTRKIKLGQSNDHQIAITKGLAEGEKVVIKPPSASENSMKF